VQVEQFTPVSCRTGNKKQNKIIEELFWNFERIMFILYINVCRTRSSSQTSPQDIDKSLLRLDGEIRRTGRVAREEIIEILQDIREMSKS